MTRLAAERHERRRDFGFRPGATPALPGGGLGA